MSKPLAIVAGAVGKLPMGGLSFHYLHYLAGLHELGYEVHYLERFNKPEDAFDPTAGTMTDDPAYALCYLRTVLPRFGVAAHRWSLIDRENRCHGSGWDGLREALDRADFLLTVADPLWFEELERCPRRAFIDGDPLFTQVAMVTGEGSRADAPRHYPVLFTFAARIGAPGCTVPDAGLRWIATRPVVATSCWRPTPPSDDAPISALLSWASGRDMTYEGRSYGHKNRSFERFEDLPQRTHHRFRLAVGTRGVPRERLCKLGWELVHGKEVTRTIDHFQEFVTASRSDLGIVKHAYVASRSGWFSDRSTCFLAAGRPVLHQDTGFTDWLPTGEGVLAFSSPDEVVDGLRRLDADYSRHAEAARAIAQEYFEASRVIGCMLDRAGFR